MFDAIRFWLEKGIDGFRVDVIYYMIKDALFRDNPPDPAYKPGQDPARSQLQIYSYNRPEVHDLIRRMRKIFDRYDDRVMIGEIYLPNSELMLYYGSNNDEAHLPFNFQLILLPWKADVLRAAVSSYEAALPKGGWPNWVLGNHDNHRIATRTGRAQARVANMLLLTVRGTPTGYYGDELAMVDVDIPRKWCTIHRNLASLASAWGVIPSAHPCSGIAARTPVSQQESPGCLWLLTIPFTTSPPSATTPARCSLLSGNCLLYAVHRPPSALEATRTFPHTRPISSHSCAGMKTSRYSSCSTSVMSRAASARDRSPVQPRSSYQLCRTVLAR